MKVRRSIAAIVALACAPSVAARSQDAPDTTRLPQLTVTATRVPVSSDAATAAVTVISGEQLRAHGVTHVAIVSQENFIAPYYRLLHPDATAADIEDCFGVRLLRGKTRPSWLPAIPYEMPDDLKSLNVSVRLYRVSR